MGQRKGAHIGCVEIRIGTRERCANNCGECCLVVLVVCRDRFWWPQGDGDNKFGLMLVQMCLLSGAGVDGGGVVVAVVVEHGGALEAMVSPSAVSWWRCCSEGG